MAYDNAGSLFALGVRLTKLDAAGAPLTGAGNCYTSSSLITINLGLTFSEPDAVEQRNGAGVTCVYYRPSPALLSGTIEEFRVCTPDPHIMQFIMGGDIITVGGVNEVQTVTISGTPTGGTFTLSFQGQTTAPIAYNAASTVVQTALLDLAALDTSDVTVAGGPGPATPYTVTFGGRYASGDVPSLTASSTGLTGGASPTVAVTTTTPGAAGGTAIGYRAPEVNTDPLPNGVAVECWTRAVVDNAFAATRPYFHWVMPRAKLRPSENFTLSGGDPTTPQFSGTTEQNAGFGDGPVADIVFPTERVWQFCRVSSIPALDAGLVTVTA